MSVRRFVVVVLALLPLSGVACSSAPVDSEQVGTSSDAITTTEAVSRAEEWVKVKLHYCQAPNGARDYDSACSTYCNRYSNPLWDAYRSDCSGLISWAWGLPAPGRVTGQFAPFTNDISHAIQAKDLFAGDAVNNSGHIMLFKEWTVPGKTATFIEEPGCSSSTPYAHEFTSNVSLNGSSLDVAWDGETFTAIRYDKIQPANLPAKGVLDTAACEGLAGWAEDPDAPAAPVTVVLDFDAPTGKPGSGSLQLVANDHRDDLCKPLGSCDHGFALVAPVGLRDGKAHSLYAYGTDVQDSSLTLLDQAPKSFTCAPPAMPLGVKRHVLTGASLKSWLIDPLLDIAHEPTAAVAALPTGADLELAPTVVISDDGSPAVYVIEGQTKRRVADGASMASWQFKASKWPAAKLGAMSVGVDWPKSRFVLQGMGDPAVYVLDVAPVVTPSPTGKSPESGNSPSNAGPGDAGCSVNSHPSSNANLLVFGALALIPLRRKKR